MQQDVLDCGAVQADALTVDRLASLEKVRFLSVPDKANAYPTPTNESTFRSMVAEFDDIPLMPESLLCFCIWLQYHETAVVPRASILAAEVQWLHSIKADLVVYAISCRG